MCRCGKIMLYAGSLRANRLLFLVKWLTTFSPPPPPAGHFHWNAPTKFLAALLLKQSTWLCSQKKRVYVKCGPPRGSPRKWHIHWKFLDFKSGLGFTTKIYPSVIVTFKWMPSGTILKPKYLSGITKLFGGNFNNGCLFLTFNHSAN